MDTVDHVAESWRDAWASIAPAARALDAWTTPWLDESARDGNPAFSAWSPEVRRGVRVVAHSRVERVSFWRRRFAEGTADEVDELVVSMPLDVKLTHDPGIRGLLESWIATGRAELVVEPAHIPTPLAA